MAAVFLSFSQTITIMEQTISVSKKSSSQSIQSVRILEPLRKFMSYIGRTELTNSDAVRLKNSIIYFDITNFISIFVMSKYQGKFPSERASVNCSQITEGFFYALQPNTTAAYPNNFALRRILGVLTNGIWQPFFCFNVKTPGIMKQTISVSEKSSSRPIQSVRILEPLRKFMSYIGGTELTTSDAVRLTYFSLSFSALLIISMTGDLLLISIGTINFIASCRAVKNVKGGEL